MGVVCFSSLKGGVGKTTVSLNVASAFAARGCETLLIDLDPSAHASNFLAANGHRHGDKKNPKHWGPNAIPSALAKLFLDIDLQAETVFQRQLLENAIVHCEPLWEPVRERLCILPAGAELRHFLWGKGARAFKTLFPLLLDQLRSSYDHVVIDTPPDFNVLTRNAIAQSDQVIVPVDPSAMSINCLEQLIFSASHFDSVNWSIVRTMVNRQATRLQRASNERLEENLVLSSTNEPHDDDELEDEFPIEDPDEFIAMLEQHEVKSVEREGNSVFDCGPIYLLNTLTYRSEQQNRLSFLGKTCFDSRQYRKLADQYLEMAREIEQVLGMNSEEEELPDLANSVDISLAAI